MLVGFCLYFMYLALVPVTVLGIILGGFWLSVLFIPLFNASLSRREGENEKEHEE